MYSLAKYRQQMKKAITFNATQETILSLEIFLPKCKYARITLA